MKKGILISALGLAAMVLSGCQNTQTGVGGSAPTNSNITQSQRSAVKTRITVDLNGGQLKGSGDTTKTFEVRFSTMWEYIDGRIATQELPLAEEIDYGEHVFKYYALDPKGDERIPENYAFVEDTTIYAHYDVEGEEGEDFEWVTWLNDDKSVLNIEKFPYGETPKYHGWTPVSKIHPDTTAFSGWDPHLEPVTQGHGPYTYTARYIDLTVEWEVLFHYNYEEGGTPKITKQMIHDGQKATDPEPTRIGYDFFGWYLNPKFEDDPYNFDAEVHGDLDLYAKWDDAKVEITFDPNGGVIKSGQSSVIVNYGTPYGEVKKQLPEVYKKGYESPDYWTLNSGSAPIEDGYKFLQSTTIFAYYGEPSEYYNITFLPDGGTWSNGKTDNVVLNVLFGSVPDLEELTLSKNDNGVISSAVNWKEAGTESSGLKPVSGDTTYTPIWQETGYEITFDANGGYFGNDPTITQKVVQTEKNKIPTCETPKRDISGTTIYTFDGWEPAIVTATEPTTYYAKWFETEDRVNITFNANGGTLVGSETLSVLRGSTFGSLTGVPEATNTGYTFKGWGNNPLAEEPIPATTQFNNDNTILYAIFGVQEFTITFKNGGGEWASGHDGDYSKVFTTGQVPKINDTLTKALDDYRIHTAVDWRNEETGEVGLKPVTGNATYAPIWSDSPTAYYIYFYANGGYFDSDGETSRKIITEAGHYPNCESPIKDKSGTTIYHFNGWDPDTEPASESSTKAYYATWRESYDTVFVNFNANGGVLECDAAIEVERGACFGTDPAFIGCEASKNGYTFEGWSIEPNGDPVLPHLTFFNDDITVLYAVYEKKQFDITFNNDGGTWVKKGTQDKITKTVSTGAIADPGDSLTKHDATKGVTYASSGWKGGVQPAFSNKEYDPEWTAQAYDITFEAGEGYFDNEAIKQKVVATPIGQLPTCVNPVRASDGVNTYEFAGWSPTVVAATGVATYVATWTPTPIIQKWIITFDANGGSEVADQEIANNEYAMEPRTTWDKHEFLGWSTEDSDPNLEHLFDFSTQITHAYELHAQWREIPDSWTVSFDPKGGDPTPAEQTIVNGNKAIEPAAPTRDDYMFMGWSTKESGATIEEMFDFNNTAITQDYTLYAQWELAPTPWRVDFNSMGGTTTPVTQFVFDQEKAIEPAAPTKEGFIFMGWSTKESGATPEEMFDFSLPITQNNTLYAQWEAETPSYNVIFNTQGGSAVPSQSVKEGETAIKPEAPTWEKHIFLGWSTQEVDTELQHEFNFATPIQQTTNLYAQWKDEPEPTKEWTVSFDAKGGSPTPSSQTILDGGFAIEPKSPTQEGKIFKGWSDNETTYSEFNFKTTQITKDTPLYAFYDDAPVVIKYKVNFYDTDGISELVDEQEIISGETAIEPKDPVKEGRVFRGWSTDKNTYLPFNFTKPITSDTPLYAFWDNATTYHRVSFNSRGGTEVPSQKIQDGQTAVEPKDPIKQDESGTYKLFLGWSTDEEDPTLQSKFDFNSPITTDITLYAQWGDIPTPPEPTGDSIFWFADLSVETQDRYGLKIGEAQYYSGEMGNFDKSIHEFTITSVSGAPLPDDAHIAVYLDQAYTNDFTYDQTTGKITLNNPPNGAYSISIIVTPPEVPTPGHAIDFSLLANEVTSWTDSMDLITADGSTVATVDSYSIKTIDWQVNPIAKMSFNYRGGHFPPLNSVRVYIDGEPISIEGKYDSGVIDLTEVFATFTPTYSVIVVVNG